MHQRTFVLLATAMGTFTFFVWLGYARTLDPTDLEWMWHPDPFTHALGWEQFRNAPIAQYPLTLNEQYGLEWSSTLVYSDSIPIAALLLRPFSALLPVPFQYLGWWVLLSLILQAYWSMRLLALRTDCVRDAALGAGFFVIAPVLLERLGLQTGLGSHWLLLWALYLYVTERALASRRWFAVLAVTAATHAYLLVMVLAIWLAHVAACAMRRTVVHRDGLYGIALVLGLAAWMHVLGYFVIGDGASGGGWRSSFDLTGLLAPCIGARLSPLPMVYDDPWDGSAYLGGGLVLLFASSIVALLQQRSAPTSMVAPSVVLWWPLVVAVAAMTLFAITNHVTFANQTVVKLPIPDAMKALYRTFRGAQRMIWVPYYTLLLAVLWLAFRAWPRRLVSIALGVALAVQAIDLRGAATYRSAELARGGLVRPLADPVWSVIAAHYSRIVSVPARQRQDPDWPTVAWFAARRDLGSNIGYLSRHDRARRNAASKSYVHSVAAGALDSRTAYLFPSSVLWEVARTTMGANDIALVADGVHLILPDGRSYISSSELPPPAQPGRQFSFAATGNGAALLVDGWWWSEWWGTWTEDLHATLVVPVPVQARARITFRWHSFPRRGNGQHVRVTIDGAVFSAEFPASREIVEHTFEVTTTAPLAFVELDVAHRRSDVEQPERGVALISATVSPPIIELQ